MAQFVCVKHLQTSIHRDVQNATSTGADNSFVVEILPGTIVNINIPETAEEILKEDYGELRWEWTRSNDSLAAGAFFVSELSSGTLQIIDLIPGNYTFSAHKIVNNEESEISSISLRVKWSKHYSNVQIFVDPLIKFLYNIFTDKPIYTFTYAEELEIGLDLARNLANFNTDCNLVVNDITKNVAKDTFVLMLLLNSFLRDSGL
ncbi:hypothetical protein Ciccas_003569 [Cichlidogyrus casuarinus]|uniref:Uncharacterized protein n=1 Tax=Cichlidogyrus casuarinus TaxID=1844966 RepID=A0ABD2QE58_9PLAT